jgi:hypothetical protein
MKTKTYHISNFGSFAPSGVDAVDGYVTIHDSDRYKEASEEELGAWENSRLPAVKHAALTERAQRLLDRWRAKN